MTPEAAFQDLAGDLDYPMTIVTAAPGGAMTGCLVGFTTQCSIVPPRFSVWLSRKNRTFRVASQTPVLVVHFPSVDDRPLATLFGTETGDEVDKFAQCAWRPGPSGAPVLEDCVRWFAGEVIEQIPADDHVGFVLAPSRGRVGPLARSARVPVGQGRRPGPRGLSPVTGRGRR